MTDLASDALSVAMLLAVVVVGRRAAAASIGAVRRQLAGASPENVLTLVAAVIATSVQGTGMWRFFGVTLALGGPLRLLLFAFIEVAQIVEALRARRNVIESEDHTAGVDGVAVWALAGLSAVLSSMDARSFPEAVFRLAVPLVAAWLWERLMAVERRRARKGSRLNLRFTPERILVWLRLAEPSDRTASEVDAHRRISRLARAAKRVRILQASDVTGRRLARALRRLDAAMEAAVEHTGLATDPARQSALVAHLGALYGAAGLADLTPAAPWATPEPPRRAPRLYRVPADPALRQAADELLAETGGQVHPTQRVPVLDRVPGAVPERPGREVPAGGDDERGEEPAHDVPDHVPAGLENLVRQAHRTFRKEIGAGQLPSIAKLKDALRIGQDRATTVQAYLSVPDSSTRTSRPRRTGVLQEQGAG